MKQTRTPTPFDNEDIVLVRVRPNHQHIEVGKGLFRAGQTFYCTRERAKQIRGAVEVIGEANDVLMHDPKSGPNRMMRNGWNR